MIILERLRNAIIDAKFLLDRGYPKSTVIGIVAQRYSLTKPERSLIYRALHTNHEISIIKNKLIRDVDKVRDHSLVIDGFNVLITLESLIRGEPILLCDDGVFRDISSSFRKYRITELTLTALNLLLEIISIIVPSEVIVVYDSPVSHSGDLAMKTRSLMKNLNIESKVIVSRTPDTTILSLGEITASSDTVILLRARHILDIPGIAISRFPNATIINITRLYAEAIRDFFDHSK